VIGQFLYKLSGRDSALPRIEPRYSSIEATVNQASWLCRVTTPPDRVFLLHGATCLANAGVATTVIAITVSVFNAQFINQFDLGRYQPATPIQTGNFEYDGQPLLLIGGEHTLNFSVTMSGAAAGNFCRFSVAGVLVPKGNVLAGGSGLISII